MLPELVVGICVQLDDTACGVSMPLISGMEHLIVASCLVAEREVSYGSLLQESCLLLTEKRNAMVSSYSKQSSACKYLMLREYVCAADAAKMSPSVFRHEYVVFFFFQERAKWNFTAKLLLFNSAD